MVLLGGSASASHLAAFQGLEAHFKSRGIDLEYVLYSDEYAVVDAFVSGEIDLAWNGPLNYLRIRARLDQPCQVIAMRDVDFDFVTHFITRSDSDIATVEDLIGKTFAFASRGSVEAGLLAYYFLSEAGINPKNDLASFSFFPDRQSGSSWDQRDVAEQVASGQYDAGAVSRRALKDMNDRGLLPSDSVRVFWSSPGYSHCCFTAQRDMDPALYRQLEEAFVTVDGNDPVGRAILEAEACGSLAPGILEGWDILEKAATQQGLL